MLASLMMLGKMRIFRFFFFFAHQDPPKTWRNWKVDDMDGVQEKIGLRGKQRRAKTLLSWGGTVDGSEIPRPTTWDGAKTQ